MLSGGIGYEANLELICASISKYEFAFRLARSLSWTFPPSFSGIVMALAHFAISGRPTRRNEYKCEDIYIYTEVNNSG